MREKLVGREKLYRRISHLLRRETRSTGQAREASRRKFYEKFDFVRH